MKSFHAKVIADDIVIDQNIFFALVMNGRSAGGFRKLAPFSDISDGLFDVLIFKQCPVLEIMPLLIQVWNGEHPKSDYIQYIQAKHVKVLCQEPVNSDLDGEAGPMLPLEIEMLHNALEVFVAGDKTKIKTKEN